MAGHATNQRRLKYVVALILLSSCAEPPKGIVDSRNVLKTAPIVRVGLVVNEPQASVAVAGPFTVSSPSGATLMNAHSLPSCAVQPGPGGLWLGSDWIAAAEARIIPERDGSVRVNGHSYRGQLLLRNGGGRITVLNLVDMERYLASVVGSEVIESWPEGALRAQAVAARTYALYKMKVSAGKECDARATTADQVYLGTQRETAKLRNVVKETAGIVALHKGQVFPTYFHSTCAGHTEEVSRALKYHSIPPLRGVVCNYCDSSKYYGWWTVVVDADALSAALRRKGHNVGRVTNVEPLEVGPSGRALKVRITSDKGVLVMKAYDFRLLVGPSQIRNTNFKVRNYGGAFEFYGRGWGHGVGMCQFGAKGLADRGYDYSAIIRYYYPTVTLARLY